MRSGTPRWSSTFETKSVHAALCQHLRNWSEIGAVKAVLNLVLEAPNPFEPKAARPPRRGFVLFALLVAMLVACFVYFGNLR
jgi:hypothetical protein